MTDKLIDDEPDRKEALALATDDELVKAWQLSGGETGDPFAEAIAEEMARRGIDF